MQKLKTYVNESATLPAIVFGLGLALLGMAGMVVNLLRLHALSGHWRMIIATHMDNLIYSMLISSPTICLQNLTSRLAEGGCRTELLWSFAHIFYIAHSPAIAALALRLILLLALATGCWWLSAGIARQWKISSSRTAWWLCASIFIVPAPFFLLNFTLGVADAIPFYQLVGWPSNLFSLVMYIFVVGGMYINQKKLHLWPIWGVFAGFWTLLHPYFIFFWLALMVSWVIIDYRLASKTMKSKLQTASLFLPSLMAGGYYFWLTRVNQFFGYFYKYNITVNTALGMLLLLAGAIMATLIGALCLKQDGQTWATVRRQFDPYLLSWLFLAVGFQFIPSKIHSRLMLMLLLPLAIFVTRLALQPTLKHFRRYLLLIFATNLCILLVLGMQVAQANVGEAKRSLIMTDIDVQAANYLSANQAKFYIGSRQASYRFPWYSHTRLLSVYQMEAPDAGLWQDFNTRVVDGRLSCETMQDILKAKQIDGVILEKYDADLIYHSAWQRYTDCGFEVAYANPDWVVYNPTIKLEK